MVEQVLALPYTGLIKKGGRHLENSWLFVGGYQKYKNQLADHCSLKSTPYTYNKTIYLFRRTLPLNNINNFHNRHIIYACRVRKQVSIYYILSTYIDVTIIWENTGAAHLTDIFAKCANSEHAFVFSCTVCANSEHAFVFSCMYSEMRFFPPVTFNPLILYLIR